MGCENLFVPGHLMDLQLGGLICNDIPMRQPRVSVGGYRIAIAMVIFIQVPNEAQ